MDKEALLPSRVLADFVCDLAKSDPRIDVVVMVGSAADRRLTSNSDIDFAVIGKGIGSSTFKAEQIQGRRVECQYFDSVWVCGLRSCPFLDLRSLREVGRLATGEVLYCRSARVLSAIKDAANVTMSPLEMTLLLGGIKCHASKTRAGSFARWLANIRALMSASIIALSLSPARYQKPKWLLQDLRRYGPPSLPSLWEKLAGYKDSKDALQFCAAVRAQALLCCDIVGLPPLTKAAQVPDSYITVRDLLQDSDSFIETDQLVEACVVAAVAMPYCEALIQEVRSDEDHALRTWAQQAESTIGIAGVLTPEIDSFLEELNVATADVVAAYWRNAEAVNNAKPRKKLMPFERSALMGITHVAPGVWFGGHQADPEMLQALGISKIVYTAREIIERRPPELATMHLLSAPLPDGPLDSADLDTIRNLIPMLLRLDDIPGDLLIVDHHGFNRSALVAGLFLLTQPGWTAPRVIRHIRQSCRTALNNAEFVKLIRSGCDVLPNA